MNFVMKLRGGTQLYGYGSGVERKETTGEGGSTAVVMLGERREDLAKAMQVDLPKVRLPSNVQSIPSELRRAWPGLTHIHFC